ncbi:MAG: type II secretion system F family protein [Methylococcaceae bacterium]
MAHFKYSARSDTGQQVIKVIQAENTQAVADIIRRQGLIPVTITPVVVGTDIIERFNQWQALKSLNLGDLVIFSRQMYSLTKAGVPLFRAIRCLTESTRNIALVATLNDVANRLEGGSPLSQAMMQHKKVFNSLFISIIHVGEVSGGLDMAFLQISNYLEREKKIQSSIKSALRYPSMVLAAISIAMVIINIYVIPSFKGTFDSLHAELPWQTKLLMSISSFTVSYWLYLLTGALLLTGLIIKYINTVKGRLHWDWLMLHLPVVGSLVQRSSMERFSRSFAMTLSTGVPLTQGLAIVSTAIGNRYITSKLDQMRIGIERGDTISRMAKSTGLFTPLVVQMIAVGEETGNISDMLLEVADFYEMEVDAALENLTSAIEPILIVVIGMMVLVLALGIFLPMWDLSSAMNKH